MKRQMLTLLMAIICLLNILPAFGEEGADVIPAGVVGKVTTPNGSLNMRVQADMQSAIKAEIPNGTCLLVLEAGENWCLCEWQGKTGYCSSQFLTLLREADPILLSYRVLQKGDKGEDVLILKQRLQELGYIRAGSSLTNVYNDILFERVGLFQQQVGMTENGIASQELQAYIFSDRAPQCSLTLPRVRSQVKNENNGLNRVICGCCMGEGCECCNFSGWIYY